jgi:hypothetical protein
METVPHRLTAKKSLCEQQTSKVLALPQPFIFTRSTNRQMGVVSATQASRFPFRCIEMPSVLVKEALKKPLLVEPHLSALLKAQALALPASHDYAQDQERCPQTVSALPVRHSVVDSNAPQAIKALAPRSVSVSTKHPEQGHRTEPVRKHAMDSDAFRYQ